MALLATLSASTSNTYHLHLRPADVVFLSKQYAKIHCYEHEGCEEASLSAGSAWLDKPFAYFHPNGGTMHSKMMEWDIFGSNLTSGAAAIEETAGGAVHVGVPPPPPIFQSFSTMRVRVLVDGKFPFPSGENRTRMDKRHTQLDAKAKEEEVNGECDVVVGISDGKNVWAVGRGESGLDTLTPFTLGSKTRNAKGHFYDVYSQQGGGHDAFWAHIE